MSEPGPSAGNDVNTAGIGPRLRDVRVNLRPGLVTLILVVMGSLIVAMTAVLYRQNAELTISTAQSAMERVSNDTVVAVHGLLDPISHSVDLAASFGRAEQQSLRRPENWRTLIEMFQQLPEAYSLYYGFAQDGGFLQVARLSPGLAAFGPQNRAPPSEARYVVRTIDRGAGELTDTYIYYAADGAVTRVERAPNVAYDPRQRPWYRDALATDGVTSSAIYIFTGTDRPGITLSRRVVTDDGLLIGAFGIDLSTDTLSTFLRQRRVGEGGVTFITDTDNELIGYADSAKSVTRTKDGVIVAKADQVSDPLVVDAIRRRDLGAGNRFRATLPEAGTTYLASFTAMPISAGKQNWVIGVIADADEFVRPLKRASLIILALGAAVLILAAVGILQVAKLLTRPIGELINETQLIRRFELDAPVQVRSRIREVGDLAASLAGMKAALRSFGLYVPRELVREIVARGSDTELGGNRRPLTIMFTDIADFTKTTEALAPEDVLDRLSDYFETMSGAIHQHRGTIDKFIGDAIMGLWNAPLLDEDHEANACLAALACRAAGLAINQRMGANGWPPFRTRYGIHSGIAVVGNVGSTQRLQYTALGGIVNLASRVEGLNKYFHTETLITGAVQANLRGRFVLRPMGPIMASGTTQPTPLFELLGTDGGGSAYPPSPEQLQFAASWEPCFAAYARRDWTVARDALTAFRAHYPNDGAAELLLSNCEIFAHHPPPDSWDGALVFDSK